MHVHARTHARTHARARARAHVAHKHATHAHTTHKTHPPISFRRSIPAKPCCQTPLRAECPPRAHGPGRTWGGAGKNYLPLFVPVLRPNLLAHIWRWPRCLGSLGRDPPQLALGSCFTYFQHPFSRRKFFVAPELREFFRNRLATERLAIPRERGKPAASDGRMGKTSG